MFFTLFGIILGLFLLIKGSDYLIGGSSSLAIKLKIPSIVVALTVVSFGTSSPELIVSLWSAFQGETGLILGNIIGSNINNLMMVMGVSALIRPLKVQNSTIFKEIPLLLMVSLVVGIFSLMSVIDSRNYQSVDFSKFSGTLNLSAGLILFLLLLIFLVYIHSLIKQSQTSVTDFDENKTGFKIFFEIFLGILMMGLGSEFLVRNSLEAAEFFKVSTNLIGLTIIAIGTSVPELVTSVKASLKGLDDISVGNVVGSNIFNLLGILSLCLIISPMTVNFNQIVDISVMVLTTIIFLISVTGFKFKILHKFEGLLFLSVYMIYFAYILHRG